MAGDPEAVVDALAAARREARAEAHVLESLRCDEFEDGRHDVDLAAGAVGEERALVHALPRNDERDAVALVRRRRLVDVVAVAVVTDDDEEAVGVFRLRSADELRELAIGVPVMAELREQVYHGTYFCH